MDLPTTPQRGGAEQPSRNGYGAGAAGLSTPSSATATPQRLQSSIPVVMEAVVALQEMQEENSALRDELDALRRGGAGAGGRPVAGDFERGHFDATLGAQRLQQRARAASAASLTACVRSAPPWLSDPVLQGQLASLADARRRNVEGEEAMLRSVQRMLG